MSPALCATECRRIHNCSKNVNFVRLDQFVIEEVLIPLIYSVRLVPPKKGVNQHGTNAAFAFPLR